MVPKLILASNSPRRRRLLAFTGWTFTVRPVDIDEDPLPHEPPGDYVLRLAENKAYAASAAAAEDASQTQIVLAADTTVADGNLILGKPADGAEARAMLRGLRGRAHTVYTGIGVLGTPLASQASYGHAGDKPLLVTDLCATRVWMRDYADDEIEAYIASGDPFDKAGGYAIQNAAFSPVERIEGCYSCVAGLPVCRVVSALARFGLTPPDSITAACPIHLEMDTPCLVYTALLREEAGGSQTRGKEK